MANADLTALKELAAQFRRRAERCEQESKTLYSWVDREEADVRANVWGNAADDLERVVREIEVAGEGDDDVT